MNTKSKNKKIIENYKPIILTKRDKELLKVIGEYRMLSTFQVAQLLFPSVNRARKRLFQLWQHGYLKRYTLPMRLGEGSSQYIYSLSRISTNLLNESSEAKATVQYRKNAIGYSALHKLRINDFRCCLDLCTKKSKHAEKIIWKEGKVLKLNTSIKQNGRLMPIRIIPDALFGLKHLGKEYYFFLEIDRGTTDLSRIKSKMRAYLTIWKNKEAVAKLNIRSFRVLFVTKSKKRIQNMLNSFENLKPEFPRSDIIYLTDYEQYSLKNPNGLLNPIWLTMDTKNQTFRTSLIPAHSLQNSRQCQVNHQCSVQNPIPVKGVFGPGG